MHGRPCDLSSADGCFEPPPQGLKNSPQACLDSYIHGQRHQCKLDRDSVLSLLSATSDQLQIWAARRHGLVED